MMKPIKEQDVIKSLVSMLKITAEDGVMFLFTVYKMYLSQYTVLKFIQGLWHSWLIVLLVAAPIL